MKYKIGLIIPYFGKLPNYFQIFLESCKHNKDFDWLLYTDDKAAYTYPQNVHVHYLEFNQMRDMIQSKFNFRISLDRPYKLCDYKAAYGYIFEEELNKEHYDFWGHCDIDLLFGNISKFVTEDILDRYDKVFYKGHFSLYKNTDFMNKLFMTQIHHGDYWKEVLSSPDIHGYDERGIDDKIGMYTIFKQEHIEVYEEPVYASLNVTKAHFQLSVYPYDDTDEKKNTNSVFVWDKGKIIRYFIRDKQINTKEYMYFHMQAHPMKNEFNWNDQPSSVLIIPNRIKELTEVINISNLKKWGRARPFYPYFWKKRFQRVVKKLLRK